ncbi:hypothetical protein HAX54_046819 [Datura stramonium]|uniref:Uncharacterized protein n=1 Tax=Datura stramonium TaxID=4076 RepID=A0ABS8SS91_DATST|nr:hypothetical protein [Datura stramonium]
MDPKSNKGKGVASSSQGTKRARMGQESQNEDASMPQPPPRVHTLGLDFVFNDTVECNLNLVRKFSANWKPKERTNQVKIRGQIVNFTLASLNRFLGTPNVDPQPMKDLLLRPPYIEI